MSWQNQLKGDSLTWLLEPVEPGVRYLALRDLAGLPPGSTDLPAARRLAHTNGPIAHILEKMKPEGWWAMEGAGYGVKYRSTVWAIILLAQLGARVEEDARIVTACQYLLAHALAPGGQWSHNGPPSGTIDCLQGNLTWALMALGCADPRLERAYEWMARSITGEGVASNKDVKAEVRYYAHQCGPNFACGANLKQPCAWAAVKEMLAFAMLPVDRRTPMIERAMQMGIEFLLGVDPATAEYPSPMAEKPSSSWWKFGFPVFYVTDILQIVEAFAALGLARDPRLENAYRLILDKQDANGRWALEYDYAGKTWGSYGEKTQPNKWVTLRVLRVLQAAG